MAKGPSDFAQQNTERAVQATNYDLATGGSSRSQGHTAMVLALPLPFFTTVIFMRCS